MIDFSVPENIAADLAWADDFVREHVAPLDATFADENVIYDKTHPVHEGYLRPLQQQVKDRGLWATHLSPELGGQGYGQVRLALLNEILGRSLFAPSVFGCQAPDSGNIEILAGFGTPEQQDRFLTPLLDGRISSAFAMTEPQGGADPSLFTTTAVPDGDEWVINGEKWFISSASHAAFFILMAITDPDVPVHRGASMFLVPGDTPGIEIVRRSGMGIEAHGEGNHPYVRFTDVRLPADALMGEAGAGFTIAQERLAGGRLHHAMRTVGALGRCLDMMVERAANRTTRGRSLADNPITRQKIAEAWVELTQFRLQVLHAAWTMDRHGAAGARTEIAGVKVATPGVYQRAVLRTMHLHGALGVSNEMPLVRMLISSVALGVADGPTEVHQATIARALLRDAHDPERHWPSEHLPTRRDAARHLFTSIEGI